MAKSSTHYVCQACGSCFPKWSGKCEGCQSWNSLIEEATVIPFQKNTSLNKKGRVLFKVIYFVVGVGEL